MRMNGASRPRRTTVGKLKRDAEKIKECARFVLLLSESGTVDVIDNGARRAQGMPYVRTVSVLGPANYDGKFLPECNLLEVGYSRTRPYANTQMYLDIGLSRSGDENCVPRRHVNHRPRVRPLSEGDTARAYPYIVECIQTIVQELTEQWRETTWYARKEPHEAKGLRFECGIYFTVSHADQMLHTQFGIEDVRHRKERYISRHASWIRSLFWSYASFYTTKQLQRFAKARRVADLLMKRHYTPFYRQILFNHFEADSRERILLDSIAEAFNVDVSSLTEHEAQVLIPSPIRLMPLENLRCYRPPKQPTVHAKGATVFEIFLEREYSLSLERSRDEKEDDIVPF